MYSRLAVRWFVLLSGVGWRAGCCGFLLVDQSAMSTTRSATRASLITAKATGVGRKVLPTPLAAPVRRSTRLLAHEAHQPDSQDHAKNQGKTSLKESKLTLRKRKRGASDSVEATTTSEEAATGSSSEKRSAGASVGKKASSQSPGRVKKGGAHEGLTPEKEKALHSKGYTHVYGVDEAGRGPLAGPVVAAACYIPPDVEVAGLRDSKTIPEEEREVLYGKLTSTKGVLWSVAIKDHHRIDEINILAATMEAMREAMGECLEEHHDEKAIKSQKIIALVDGNRWPDIPLPGECIIKGDAKVRCIAAASIIAKVTRDRIMIEADAKWPVYGFRQHKGYPTFAHRAAIAEHGPCPIHRMTFAPLKEKDKREK